jgi:hypothetical protein
VRFIGLPPLEEETDLIAEKSSDFLGNHVG